MFPHSQAQSDFYLFIDGTNIEQSHFIRSICRQKSNVVVGGIRRTQTDGKTISDTYERL